MPPQSNYWPKEMNKRSILRTLVTMLAFAVVASAQSPQSDPAFKRETVVIQAAVDDVVNSTVPGYALLTRTRSVYLEGFGVVFTLEVSLEEPRSPFFSPKTPDQIRALVDQRLKTIRGKLIDIVQQKTSTLAALPPAESVAIVMYLVNSNPADLPNLPATIVTSLKKQDALDAKGSLITAEELFLRVRVQESK